MTQVKIDALDPRKFITIKGARANNLKNISVAIPRKKLVVITGVSGSGKSSLAFDTLYAEGQRRYVESLSSYARQFLGRLDKPEVDYIRGISPAVVVEQKVVNRSSRSTVGTSTEIFDYLKLLYARIGKTFSPTSGKLVTRHRPEDVLKEVLKKDVGSKYMVLAPQQKQENRTLKTELELLLQKGFSRIMNHDHISRIEDLLDNPPIDWHEYFVVVDRLTVDSGTAHSTRLLDSLEIAFFEGHGNCLTLWPESQEKMYFSNRFELDGQLFEEPTVAFFSFNNPVGACKSCEGFGSVIGIDPKLVIPDPSLTLYEDAVVCWASNKMRKWKDALIAHASKSDFPIHKPIKDLTKSQYNLLWSGNENFEGINQFFKYLESKSYKIQYRVMLSRFRGKTLCPNCQGTRIREDASYVRVGEKSIIELIQLPISSCLEFFNTLKLNEYDTQIAKHLLKEITNRLGYLCDVGLSYLTLNRLSSSLSGGESQRINLATCLGSSLVGSMYILDEPSIGLHPKDTEKLIQILKALRDLGNTVIVVEHDELIMQEADYIIDMGPLAGSRGGEVVFSGNHSELIESDSLTSEYLTGRKSIQIPKKRKIKDFLEISGAKANNLKNIDVKIPLHAMVTVTGVSGSGKSTLVANILYPALKRHLGEFGLQMGELDNLGGEVHQVKQVEHVDQNPIGISSRSNPVTYLKAFDEIRGIMANQPLSKARGYKPSHFSFNVSGGRCDTCEGEGWITIAMQFMADIKLKCESCGGHRYKDEILEIKIDGKNISDILNLTVDNALSFFSGMESSTSKKLVKKILPLQDVGLGYIQLGQPSNTLSGGEAQRIKLASFLSKGDRAEHTLFIFDEPTTGLHFDDTNKLLQSFYALISQGHSILIVEHNLDVIKCSDWVIDLGPEGGQEGGYLLFSGPPEELVKQPKSYTGKFLYSTMSPTV